MKNVILSVLRKFKRIVVSFIRAIQYTFSTSQYFDTIEHARLVLEAHSPMPQSSALCNHEWKMLEKGVLTIIVPAYNSEKWISECVDSIINQQTKIQYRLIVVNDGSTDSTLEFLQKYKEKGEVTLINQDNHGYSGARNVALRMVTSEYIMFVDSDDILLPGAIECLMSKALAEGADIVEGNGYTFNETGRLNKIKPNDNVLWGGPCLKVMKTSLWEQIEFPEGYLYEDTIINSLIEPLSQKTVFIPDEMYGYRIHENSITQKQDINPQRIDSLWIMLLMRDNREELGLSCDNDESIRRILRHAVITYRRTQKLPEEIKRSIFIATKDFISTEGSYGELGSSYRRLYSCIREGQYKRYCILCETIKL